MRQYHHHHLISLSSSSFHETSKRTPYHWATAVVLRDEKEKHDRETYSDAARMEDKSLGDRKGEYFERQRRSLVISPAMGRMSTETLKERGLQVDFG